MEVLEKLLSNPLLMIPLVGVIAALLDALRDWIKTRWPSGAEAIELYWDYLRPAIDSMVEEIKTNPDGQDTALKNAMIAFMDSYRKYERSEPTQAIMRAIAGELYTVAQEARK